jgi:hypothetical protein
MLAKHKNSIGMEYHDEDRYVFAKPPKKLQDTLVVPITTTKQ